MNGVIARYDAYKESDSSWIEKVPEHWKSGRIKDFIDVCAVTRIPINLTEDAFVEFVPMTNVDEKMGKIKGFEYVPLNEVSKGYTKFKNYDVIFAKITPCMENGNCAIVEGAKNNICFGSTEFMVFRAAKGMLVKYLHYFLHNDLLRKNAEPFMKGSAGQKRISTQYMVTHSLAMPPVDEQQSIVDYLDAKTAQIDSEIELLGLKATRYAELKQALINETVTRGLDKNVKLKDSCVEWIGKVPEHWEIARIGSAFKERREKVNDTDYPPLSVTMQGIVPQLEKAAKTDHNDNRRRVAKNDFVINSRSDRKGSSGISELDGSVSVINIVLTPRKHVFGKFLHHLFRSYRFKEEFYKNGRGIVEDLWTTKYFVMKAIEFAFPSIEEQEAIAIYLDEKTTQIDQIIDTINVKIAKMQELRRTLINDVVTGKIKVS